MQVISGDGEVLQYVYPDPGEPTTTAHASAKALVKPAVPPHDVPSKPLLGGSVLMKPTGSRQEAGEALRGRAKPAGRVDVVAQEVKPPCCFADKAFVRVHMKLQLLKHPVHHPDRRPKGMAGGGEDHVVVHEPAVPDPPATLQLLHRAVERRQVHRAKQRGYRAAGNHAGAGG